ncbi:uncharacterized protein LOC135473611 [Liolophura sinensis]|uniref:uncharacterized protein LOC135473611 n=1 Tax=Liolophura sinensis TaxID=3198878 RepID=UPI00315911FF
MGCAISLSNRVSAGDSVINVQSQARLTRVTTFRAVQDVKPRKQNGRISAFRNGNEKHHSSQTLLTLPEESCVDDFRNGPGQKFFQDFPTPSLLEEAQREYSKCGYEVSTAGGIRKLPFPAQNWKRDVFKLEDFVEIDRHATQMPAECCLDNLEDLVGDLLKPTKDSLGAVRVIFRWIAAQDINNMDLIGVQAPCTAGYYFLRIKQGKGGYAELFQKMCSLAKVACVLIHGFVKGVGYEPGEEVTDHVGVWSAVFVRDSWRLVDCQWGSSHVSVGGAGGSSASSKKQHRKAASMSYAYEEFYFLTDPHHLIYSHFPYDDRWQLLARPLTLDEFQKMAYLKPSFFDLAFDLDSHPKCILEFESTQCTLTLKVAQSGRRRFVYRLYLLQRNGVISETNETYLENFVFLEILKESSTMVANIHFPFPGKYKFKLFSKDTTNECNEFSSICSYVIYCDQAVKLTEFEPNPNNPRHEWGLGADTEALGIELASHKSGRIETEAGEVEIRFRLHKDVEILHKLLRKGESEAKYKNFAFSRREGNDIIFKVRLPRVGKYMLCLYAKEVGANGNFPNVCNFLLVCDEPAEDLSPFPAVYNGRVGPNGNFRQLNMATVGGDSGYFTCSESGELVVRFQTPESVCLVPKLCLQDGSSYKELDEYAICKTNSGKAEVHMVFPEPGTYQFILYGKDRSSSVSGYPPVYYGMIQADFPKVGALPFPKVFSNWKDNFRLLEPTSGFLPTNCTIRFLVDIPGAAGVAVIGGTWNHLHQNENGLWDGSLDTGDKECDLKLSASLTKGSGKYSCLQMFKVVSDESLKQMIENQKESYKASQVKVRLKKEKKDAVDLQKGRVCRETIEQRKKLEDERGQMQSKREEEIRKVKNDVLMKKVAEELQRQKTNEDLNKVDTQAVAEYQALSEMNAVRIGGGDGGVGDAYNGGARVEGGYVVDTGFLHGTHTDGTQFVEGQIVEIQPGGAQSNASNFPGGKVGGAQANYTQYVGDKGGVQICTLGLDELGRPVFTGGNGDVPIGGATHGIVKTDQSAKIVEMEQPEEDVRNAERQAALLELSIAQAGNLAEKEKQEEIAEATRAKAAQEELQAAMQKADKNLLEAAIKGFREKNIKSLGNVLEDAQRLLDKLALRESLKNAIEAKDMVALKRTVWHIEDRGFQEFLGEDLTKGKEKLKILERLSKLKSSILSMDAGTMTELRRYNNPPEMVHQVMIATFLLLGEHEGITKKWKNCQKRCNPTGPDGLKRRVLEFDVDQLHPEIAARAAQILSEVELDDVRLISSGAAAFYVWVKGIIQEMFDRQPDGAKEIPPASKFRQKQIFLGRGDIDDDDGDRPISRASLMRPTTSRTIRPTTTRSVRRPSIAVQ